MCVGGQLAFLPTVLLLAGRWLPSRARRDAEERRRAVDEELARLGQPGSPGGPGGPAGPAGHRTLA